MQQREATTKGFTPAMRVANVRDMLIENFIRGKPIRGLFPNNRILISYILEEGATLFHYGTDQNSTKMNEKNKTFYPHSLFAKWRFKIVKLFK